MKKTFYLLASLVLFCCYSFAGIPPETVKKAFDQKFPNAANVKWGKESAKEWEAEFVFNGNKVSANFNTDGTWLETESNIAITDLPKTITEAVSVKYSGWTITIAEKSETPGTIAVYELVIKKDKVKKELAFNEDGTPAKVTED